MCGYRRGTPAVRAPAGRPRCCLLYTSFRFPVPKPITERNTPLSFFPLMSRTSSPSLVTPTFRSPSVARIDVYKRQPWYHLNSRAGARALSTPLTEGNRLGLLTRLWTFSRAAHERLSTGPARELTPWRACCPPPLPLWAFETDILTRSLLFLALFDIKQHHTTPPTVCQPGRRKEADFFCFSQRSGKERKINFERLHKSCLLYTS